MSSISGNIKCAIVVLSVIALPVLAMGYTPPAGIPNPSDSFGTLDPVEEVAPAQPSGWPGAEVPGFYYIDNSGACSDSNQYGHPDNPRCKIPEITYGEGAYVEVHGGPYEISNGDKKLNLDFNCSEENPCWFRGPTVSSMPTIKGIISITGRYAFIENIFFQGSESNGNITILVGNKNGSANYMIFRHCEVASDGKYYPGFGSAFSTSGVSASNKTSHIVFYDNHIHDLGDDNSAVEDDYHGILPARYSEQIWALNNHIHDNGGDAMQVGSNNFTGEEMPRFIYVGNNEFHGDLENAIDVKNAQDVIVSSNDFYDYHLSPGSDGTAVVVHQQNGDIPKYIWIMFNRIHDAVRGVRAQQAENVKIIGNTIYNIHHEGGDWSATSAWSEGSAIMIRSGDSIGGVVVGNTIYNCDLGLQSPNAPPIGWDIQDNIISNRAESSGYDVNMATSDGAASIFNNNLFFIPSGNAVIRWRGTNYSLSSFKSVIGKCTHCVEAEPQFVNASQHDFTLQDTSPANNLLEGSHPVYTTFYNRYGIDISGGQVSGPPDGGGTGGGISPPSAFMLVN